MTARRSNVTAWCGSALREALVREGLDTVDGAFTYRGGLDMTVPNLGHRERMRLEVCCGDGSRRVLFMKRYGREPLWWRIRRWLTYGPHKSPAGVEIENIRTVHDLALPTIPEALGGEEFDLWGARRSYIVMAAVEGEALEQCAETFLLRHAAHPEVLELFTARLADLVRRFHEGGFVHRDMYSSHVFLCVKEGGFELSLIDLARVFRPRWRKRRWRVKDVAGLKYSMPPRWIDAYWDCFLRAYLGDAGEPEVRRWKRRIDRKVAYMRWRIGRKRRRRSAEVSL